jgi:hypothetical protein
MMIFLWLLFSEAASVAFADGEFKNLQSVLQSIGCYSSRSNCSLRSLIATSRCTSTDYDQPLVCDGKGRVVQLNLQHSRLDGTIPSEMPLSHLEFFDLWDNDITHVIPTQV